MGDYYFNPALGQTIGLRATLKGMSAAGGAISGTYGGAVSHPPPMTIVCKVTDVSLRRS
jgi:hypothetical protein